MTATAELVVREPTALAVPAMTIEQIIAQKKLVAQCVAELMKEGEHFGVIPGTEKTDKSGKDVSKRVLFKAGADMLCSLFRLAADYETLEAVRTPTLIYYRLKCTLTSAPNGIRRGSGLGSCNSNEEKYIRAAAKKCPKCGKETIFRSKLREGERGEPGWYCWNKKGGCGANFVATDPAVVDQDSGIKDPADLDNTILKMAAKRARVDAILTVTGASDFFTQDVEDLTEREAEYIPPPAPAPASKLARIADHVGAPPPPEVPREKRPAANTIKHDGKLATPDQVRLLHTLKHKLGLPECGGPDVCSEAFQQWSKREGKPVDKMRWCPYHTQLLAFRDQAGERVRTSKDLSQAQISNLIDRYQEQLKKHDAARAQKGDAPDIAELLGPEPPLADLVANIQGRGIDENELCAVFAKERVLDLTRDERIMAGRLVEAWDTDRWELARDQVYALIQERT